jgi:hypothetical protein
VSSGMKGLGWHVALRDGLVLEMQGRAAGGGVGGRGVLTMLCFLRSACRC